MEVVIDSPKQGLGAEQLGFPVRRVPRDAPWDWLSRGWRDLCTVPSVSVAYGAFFSIAAWIILFVLSFLEVTSLIPVLAAGFLLIAPLLAAGLYETSRRLEKGRADHSAQGLRRLCAGDRPAQFLRRGSVLAFFAWVELAFLLLHRSLVEGRFRLPASRVHLLFTNAGVGLLFTGRLTGAMLAAIVSSISGVAVPLLLVKNRRRHGDCYRACGPCV